MVNEYLMSGNLAHMLFWKHNKLRGDIPLYYWCRHADHKEYLLTTPALQQNGCWACSFEWSRSRIQELLQGEWSVSCHLSEVRLVWGETPRDHTWYYSWAQNSDEKKRWSFSSAVVIVRYLAGHIYLRLWDLPVVRIQTKLKEMIGSIENFEENKSAIASSYSNLSKNFIDDERLTWSSEGNWIR